MDDEDGFDSDSSSISFLDDHENITANLGTRCTNKQIETLKYLRHVLRENKLLRQRLELVEEELERCHEFGWEQPVKPANAIMPLKDRATSAQSQKNIDFFASPYTEKTYSESRLSEKEASLAIQAQIVNEIQGETAKLVEPPRKELFIECSVEPMKIAAEPQVLVQIVPNNASPVKKVVDMACQSDDLFSDKLKIKELENQLGQSKLGHEKEKKSLGFQIHDLNEKVKKLEEKIVNLEKSVAIGNDKYGESERNNMKLSQEISELRPVRQKYELLKVENDRLYSELKNRQCDVDDSNSKFLELTQSLNKTLAMLEDQKSVIVSLEAANQRHLREKHLTCQAKIDELASNCANLSEELSKKSQQVEMLAEVNREAEKQVERYKADMKNFNFKEFVSMKRELNSLKQDREQRQASVVILPSTGKNSASEVGSILPPINKESAAAKKNSFQFF